MREEQALLAQDYALEQAEEKGLERDLERGKVEGREEGETFCLSGYGPSRSSDFRDSKPASQQLGMSVAEFEALL